MKTGSNQAAFKGVGRGTVGEPSCFFLVVFEEAKVLPVEEPTMLKLATPDNRPGVLPVPVPQNCVQFSQLFPPLC